MYRPSASREVSLNELVSSLCTHCSVILGSSSHLPSVVEPSDPDVVSWPAVYAMLSSLLFAHSHPSSLNTPHALGLLSMAATSAQTLHEELGRLLAHPLTQTFARRKQLFAALSAPLLESPSRDALLVAPFTHRIGAHLSLHPTARVASGLVVVPRAPAIQLNDPSSALPCLDDALLDVFLALTSSGLSHQEAYEATHALSSSASSDPTASQLCSFIATP